jgi:hypothetical protein
MRRIFMVPQERRATEVQLAILEELILLRRDLRQMQQQINDAFTELNERVTNIESAEQAAETLLTTLNQQLQTALSSSSDPTEVVANIQAISDRLNTDAAGLAAAITANTPPAPASGGSTGTDTGAGSDTSGSDTSGSGTSGGDTSGTGGDATDPTA